MKEKSTLIIFSVLMILFIALAVVGSFGNKENAIEAIKTETDMVYQEKDQPLIGLKDAPVSITVFFDYNCPHCQDWEKMIYPVLKKEAVDKGFAHIRFVHFPIINTNSTIAAMGSETFFAMEPDSFESFHNKLFLLSPNISVEKMGELAKKVAPSINQTAFEKAINEQVHIDDVLSDAAEARRNGLNGTPSVLIDGKPVDYPTDVLSMLKTISEKMGGKTK